ncbi:type II CAAX endopeptidase family protein [Lysobacter sp. ISL-50]|uniref:CPBP family intramembrane glutamic endopeptidase n=1 Tax=unclassified Lysobacter TaxID=2635362 RepID=UPI0031BB7E8A
MSVAAFGAAVLAMIVIGRNADPAQAGLARYALVMVLVVGVTWFYMRRDGLRWFRYGVSVDARAAIACLTGMVGGSLLALLWALIVWVWAPFHWQSNPTLRMDALLAGALAALVMGVAEEVGYRSYGLERLYIQYGAVVSVLASSAVFVLAHLTSGMPWLAGLLVVGSCSLLYGSLMLVTRSLPLVTAFHIANNLVQDALLRTGAGSIWQPVFQNADAPHRHQMAIWVSMALVNLALTAGVWTHRARLLRA